MRLCQDLELCIAGETENARELRSGAATFSCLTQQLVDARRCAQCCHLPCAGERINDLKLILGRVAEVSTLLQWHTALHLASLSCSEQ